MLKMTIALTAALYAAFVIWGEPTKMAGASTTLTTTAGADPIGPTAPLRRDGAVPDVTRAAFDPASIAVAPPAPTLAARAPRLIGEPIVVNLVRPAEAGTRETTARDGLVAVSGNRVNMRSGPSTSNAVIASLPRGTLAEPLGAPQGGWQQIRDVETGRTGWMSARFLEPA